MIAPCSSVAPQHEFVPDALSAESPDYRDCGAIIENVPPCTIGYRLPIVVCARVATPETTKKVPISCAWADAGMDPPAPCVSPR